MKYFVVFALCVAAASAFAIPPTVTGADAAEIQQIIDAIYHPSTDPATAAALEEMLLEILGINKPVVIEDQAPIVIEPEIIDESIISEPGIPEHSPIEVGPAIIDESIISEPTNYRLPLVQVIVNVNTNPGKPKPEKPEKPEDVVVVEKPELPEEAVVVEEPEFPEEVVVVEKPELPEEAVVVEKPELPAEPVIVAPIEPVPVITIPDALN